MDAQFKEMKKLLEEIDSDLQSLSRKAEPVQAGVKREKADRKNLESVIREECAEIKRMIKQIDNQTIADSVSRMVVSQIMSPLQDALESAVKGKSEARSIGEIAEDMKRKVERLSERHIKVIKCISQANGEWVNYDSLSGVCRLSQSCLRGYISDLKRVYEIPIETTTKEGKVHVRIDPHTVKKIALGYQATKIEAMDSA
jgi:chromosome segregation ATPase